MPQTGKNKGNKNAALPEGQRKRVQFSVSISGERLNRLAEYVKIINSQETVSDGEIAAEARQMLEAWIDNLAIQ